MLSPKQREDFEADFLKHMRDPTEEIAGQPDVVPEVIPLDEPEQTNKEKSKLECINYSYITHKNYVRLYYYCFKR